MYIYIIALRLTLSPTVIIGNTKDSTVKVDLWCNYLNDTTICRIINRQWARFIPQSLLNEPN